jgi:CHAT domain
VTALGSGAVAGVWDPTLVPRLWARHEPGALRFELAVPAADLDDPLQGEFTQPIEATTLEQILGSAARLMQATEAGSFWSEAQRAGELLFRTLIPTGLHGPLGRLAGGPLLVRTNLPGLAWELLHDGHEFWGLGYALGTQLVANAAAPPWASPPSGGAPSARPRVLLIGSDPNGDLGSVRFEIDALVRMFEQGADVHCLTGVLANFAAVAAGLADQPDLFHYCGHVVSDPEGQPALLLPDRTLLTGALIRRNVRGRPSVFLNGCGSASARLPQEGGMTSLADQFLLAGARSVVATLHPVRDGEAERIATEFYSELLAHQPIGEALRRARDRNRTRGAACGGGLGFVLFGNPAVVTCPVPPTSVPIAAATATATTTRRRLLMGAGLAATASAVGWMYRGRGRHAVAPGPDARGRPLVIWIGPFLRPGGGPPADPLGRALSDGLASRLRLLRLPHIYSAADMPVSGSEPQSELEIVKTLRATKSVVAHYRLDGGALEATVRIVDVETGIAEPSFKIAGTRQRTDELLVAIAEQIVSSLRIVRMMLEGEGIEQVEPAPDAEPFSGSRRLLALRVPFVSLVWAGEREDDVRGLLERYRLATEQGDLDAVAACYVEFPASQRESQQRYLDNVRGLRVRLDVTRLEVTGDHARVEYTRTDDFIDGRTGRAMHLEVRLARNLLLADAQWRFVQGPRRQQGGT